MDLTSKRVMNSRCVQFFIKTATDEDVPDTDPQLMSMILKYDTNQDGLLEVDDFLTFWRTSVFEKEEVVRNNLYNYGYRHDLKRQPVDGSDYDMMQVRPNLESMPRFKIAQTPFYFNTLFDVIDHTENDLAQASWQLLRTISTNPTLYRRVLALDRDPGFKWEDIFDSDNIHKMLYVL